MLIRQATIHDLPTLLQFEQGVINAERPFDRTLIPGAIKYYDLEMFITSPDVELLVAEIDGELVGSGYARIKQREKVYFDFERFAYLGFMYVLPQYRGNGVNQAIIEELKKWSLKQGLTELRLQVYADNESAVRAYEKVGFNKHMIEMRMGLD
ncbi:GNAT family N-acetyltransferase [Mucilaginibacter sp. FT3.2]|uniref:GNAT family N-acetyltransferase n=1 Tax=Mucilaginibacter sp. FT3.2 TaxID=2723090 RepID=UPI00161FDAAD|nr:GNAT family N-acetyltransferase [Mucilaginibacter sp. FT3.2]MBB6234851.1 GNAT superfamily N-acetyltransferase [Mucilaginibacter sp. FT3.2]